MSREIVFIDTAALLALSTPTDSLHKQANAVLDEGILHGWPFVSTDFVLIEYLNACSAVRRRREAARTARELMADPSMTIIECDRAMLRGAMELYESRPDKEWGIVDCSSILICRDRGIKRVFTHDRHFRQAGFEILL